MRKTSFVALLVAVAMLIPVGVFASHQFNDVPDSHTFHNAIAWMKDNNITVGCNPPANNRYCPSNNVTRGEMAAFMKRLAENNVVDAATLDGKDGVSYTNPAAAAVGDNTALVLVTPVKVAEVSVEAPAAGGFVMNGQVTPPLGVTAQFSFWLQADNTTCTFDVANFYSIDYGRVQATAGTSSASVSVVGGVAVSAGAHTVTLCSYLASGGPVSVDSSIVAQYVTSMMRTGTLSSAPDAEGDDIPSS